MTMYQRVEACDQFKAFIRGAARSGRALISTRKETYEVLKTT